MRRVGPTNALSFTAKTYQKSKEMRRGRHGAAACAITASKHAA
jgi:hypothetical protein